MKEIKDRIAHVIKLKDITATQLADDMNVQRSGISHILSGRNNPSLDFITKLKETYSEFNLDWLLLGEGPVTGSRSIASKPIQADLFEIPGSQIKENTDKMTSNTIDAPGLNQNDKASKAEIDQKSSSTVMEQADTTNKKASFPEETKLFQHQASKKIVRMLFIYNDQTFSTFEPSDD